MQTTLRQQLTQFAHVMQFELFPVLAAQAGPLTESAQRLVSTLAMLPLARFIPMAAAWNGRPPKSRIALASAFVARAVYNLPTTRQLLEKLQAEPQLRRICGWRHVEDIPHESTFSRAFAEFATMQLPELVHECLIRETQRDRLIGHISRDATAIHAREKTDPDLVQKPLSKRREAGLKREAPNYRPKGLRGSAGKLSKK